MEEYKIKLTKLLAEARAKRDESKSNFIDFSKFEQEVLEGYGFCCGRRIYRDEYSKMVSSIIKYETIPFGTVVAVFVNTEGKIQRQVVIPKQGAKEYFEKHRRFGSIVYSSEHAFPNGILYFNEPTGAFTVRTYKEKDMQDYNPYFLTCRHINIKQPGLTEEKLRRVIDDRLSKNSLSLRWDYTIFPMLPDEKDVYESLFDLYYSPKIFDQTLFDEKKKSREDDLFKSE